MSVMMTFRLPSLIFMVTSFINLGPASFGLLNSIKAGRKKSTITMAIVAARLAINEPES